MFIFKILYVMMLTAMTVLGITFGLKSLEVAINFQLWALGVLAVAVFGASAVLGISSIIFILGGI